MPMIMVLAVVVVLVKLIVEAPPLNANPDIVARVQTVPVPVKLMVDVPRFKVLVLLFELLKVAQVIVLLLVLNVPPVTVNELLELNVSPS